MENASKALLIAGAMLLFILIVTFAIFLFQRMASQASNVYDELYSSEIDEFNQKFLNFNGRDDLNIQNVVTIINLARENNSQELFPVTIVVNFIGTEVQEYNNDEIVNLLMNYRGSKDKFTCNVTFETNSRLVKSIKIIKTP